MFVSIILNFYIKIIYNKIDPVFFRKYIVNELNKPTSEKVFIFASNWGLSSLFRAKLWSVDNTFSIAPQNFYQVMNILAFDEINQIWSPCLFAFMSRKTQRSYDEIFSYIQSDCQSKQIVLNVKYVLCDFEKAIHNSLLKYLKVKILDVFFTL